MHIIVFITAPDSKEAGSIARGLVKRKLAACANIIDGVRSVFRWKGKIDTAKESLLVVKSTRAKFSKLAAFVRKEHSYEVPEIIAFEISAGSKEYLEWIDASVR
jgi:periplasmic divalent cation tolerance protein